MHLNSLSRSDKSAQLNSNSTQSIADHMYVIITTPAFHRRSSAAKRFARIIALCFLRVLVVHHSSDFIQACVVVDANALDYVGLCAGGGEVLDGEIQGGAGKQGEGEKRMRRHGDAGTADGADARR